MVVGQTHEWRIYTYAGYAHVWHCKWSLKICTVVYLFIGIYVYFIRWPYPWVYHFIVMPCFSCSSCRWESMDLARSTIENIQTTTMTPNTLN